VARRAVAVVILRLGPEAIGAPLRAQIAAITERYDTAITIVENPATINEGRQKAESKDEDYPVLRLPSNVGYAAAVNVGWRALMAHHPDVVLVLTDDVEVSAGTLSDLIDTAYDHGICGPMIETEGQLWIGGTWSDRWGWARPRVVGAIPETAVEPARWVDGACMAVNRVILEELQGFDDRTFLYMEDVQLCVQATQMGHRVRVNTSVRIRQRSGMERRSGAHGYLLLRNEHLVKGREGRDLALFASGAARIGLEAIRGVVGRRSRRHHLRQVFGMGLGLVAAWKRTWGPPPNKLLRWAGIPAVERSRPND
jgi:N-acetylglucosaminyl-diphospho-decaprenol L-rhamnosyltransferase